jgi:hypothetical protein
METVKDANSAERCPLWVVGEMSQDAGTEL